MSINTASAIKAALETRSLGLPIFSGSAPQVRENGTQQAMPYLVIQDYISNLPRSHGSGGYKTTRETCQIDVYWHASDPRRQLVREVERALSGLRLITAPETVFRVELQSTLPTPDPDPKVTRYSITVVIWRKL